MTTDNDTELKLPQRSSVPLKAGANIAAIIPTTVEEAYRLATAIIKAGLAPDSYNIGGNGADRDQPDPQKILIGILKSLEVGLPPISGLSQIAIINKRPSLWGDGALALVQQAGLVQRVEQGFEGAENTGDVNINNFPDDFRAVYKIWRKAQPNPYEGIFSVRDAKRANLWSNPRRPIWIQYPKRMLMARARAYALREGFADALSGLAIREELEELPPLPPVVDTSFLDAPSRKEVVPHTEFRPDSDTPPPEVLVFSGGGAGGEPSSEPAVADPSSHQAASPPVETPPPPAAPARHARRPRRPPSQELFGEPQHDPAAYEPDEDNEPSPEDGNDR